uniref:Ankyrin repeat containing protein n=1 Tax=Apapanepox virus TaxID=3049969 RepID=A0AAT9UQT6_9POXV
MYPLLFNAVETRNISKIISLLENGADVNESTDTNITVMHSITNIISFTELCSLLKTYGDTILLDNYIKTFFVYNEIRNLKIAWILLKYGANVNAQSDYGITPLHIAAESGSLKMVTLLLNNGANVNSLTKYGESALHYAASVKDIEMCRLLLQYNIDVNIKNSKCITALHIAIEVESYDIMILLLQHGANVNAVSFYLNDIKRIEKNEDLMLIKYLRDIKLLDLDNSQLLNDYTKSHLNDIRRYSACSKLVLSSMYQHCISPLIFLSKKGRINEVRLLLEDYKADPNITDSYYCTPLHHSISNKHLNVSELLVYNDANVNSKDLYMNTPSHYACKIVNDDSFIKMLIDNNANIEERNVDHETPLHIACKLNNIPVIKRLLSRGVLTNLADIRCNYPLQYAVANNCEASVKLLLNGNADPNLCMDVESSPIVTAVNNNNKEILKQLLLFGANVEFINECEILHKLANEKNCEMLKFLIQIDGVNLSKTDDEGFPLVYYISKLHDTSIMENILLNDFVDIHEIIRDRENVFTIIFSEYGSMAIRMIEFIISYVAIQIHINDNTNNSGYYLNKGICITRSKIESSKYLYAIYKRCETEILKMREIKIGKRYTLVDVYNGKLNVNFLAKCCCIFSNIDIRKCFPIYNRYINRYLKASIKRHRLLQSAVTTLDKITSNSNHHWIKLPFDIRLLILEYLESKDLIVLTHPDTICRLSLYNTFG